MKTPLFPILTTALLTLCGVSMLTLHAKAADKGSLNPMEVKFVREAADGNMAEVKMGELGVTKAEDKDVKSFAEKIVKDHSMAIEELKKLATTKGVELSAIMGPKHATKVSDMEKLSGAAFDKHFVAEMVSDHKMEVSQFEKASNSGKDADLKAWVDKMIPTLKAHLAKAQELHSKDMAKNTATAVATTTGTDNADNARPLTPFDQGTSKSDIEITKQIRKEIMAGKSMSVNAQNVKIITMNGKVTLRGPVNSADEKHLIAEIAGHHALPANVDSQLEVK